MSENINCYKHLLPKEKIGNENLVVNDGDEKDNEDSKDKKGKYQKTSDWMRNGGMNESITR